MYCAKVTSTIDFQVVKYLGELRKFYLRLEKEKGKKIAVVATARK